MKKINDSMVVNSKKLKKSYQDSYLNALHSNDLSIIKQLTALGQPMPLSDKSMGLSVISSLFFMQTDEDLASYGQLLYYIYENGIHNTESKENEKKVLLTNGFGFHIEEFIIPILENHYEEIQNILPLEFFYYQILHMKNNNQTKPFDIWCEKKLPHSFESELLLIYAFNNSNSQLFNQFFETYSQYLGQFLNHYSIFNSMSYWIKGTIEGTIYSSDENSMKNLFFTYKIINFFNTCSTTIWEKSIEQLNELFTQYGKSLPVELFINYINANRMYETLDNYLENKTVHKLKNKL